MMKRKEQSRFSEDSEQQIRIFEKNAYFVMSLFGMGHWIVFLVHWAYYIIIAGIAFFVVTIILVLGCFFIPYPHKDPLVRRGILIFVCLLNYLVILGLAAKALGYL